MAMFVRGTLATLILIVVIITKPFYWLHNILSALAWELVKD